MTIERIHFEGGRPVDGAHENEEVLKIVNSNLKRDRLVEGSHSLTPVGWEEHIDVGVIVTPDGTGLLHFTVKGNDNRLSDLEGGVDISHLPKDGTENVVRHIETFSQMTRDGRTSIREIIVYTPGKSPKQRLRKLREKLPKAFGRLRGSRK